MATATTPALFPAVHTRQYDAKGAPRRRCLEYSHDLPILESDRKYHWLLGRRPEDRPGLSDLGL
jgi:nuclear transport factor 2 (NTF2) superfamily protein